MAALISREESNEAVENTVLGCESASNSDGESAAECDALSSDVESHDGEEELAGMATPEPLNCHLQVGEQRMVRGRRRARTR